MEKAQPHDYLEAFLRLIPERAGRLKGEESNPSSTVSTRAFIRTVESVKHITLDELPQTLPAGSVTVIENIDVSWVKEAGARWGIDPLFFASHALDRSRSRILWTDVFGSSPADQKRPFHHPHTVNAPPTPRSHPYQHEHDHWHVDGILKCGWNAQRPADLESVDGIFSRRYDHSTFSGWYEQLRISCCFKRVEQGRAYIVLFDTPRIKEPEAGVANGIRYGLHLPVANNRGGLVLSGMYDQESISLWPCLWHFLSHSWHFDVLFNTLEHPVTPSTFFHLLVASTSRANLRILDDQIKFIAFKQLKRPDITINDRLHSRREDLVSLQARVAEARRWMPGSVKSEIDAIRDHALLEQTYIGFPGTILDEIQEDSKILEKFLMDSFHLLLSSISVLEAKASIEQSRRAQRLTQLAFLYIPLSFVTGIFGMNLREINGSAPPVWIFVCVLAGAAVGTVLAYFCSITWEKRGGRKKEDSPP